MKLIDISLLKNKIAFMMILYLDGNARIKQGLKWLMDNKLEKYRKKKSDNTR